MGIVFSETGTRIIGPGPGQVPALTITETPVSSGGTATPETYDDMEYDAIVGGTILQHADVSMDDFVDSTNLGLLSSDTDVATIQGNKILDTDSGGAVSIYVTRYGYAQQKIDRDYEIPPSVFNDTTGYIAGTLGAHILAAMKTLINGLTQSNAIQEYLTVNNADLTNPSVTVNPNIFTGALDFAATSVMTTGHVDDRYPPALVTNRHAIIARHVRPANGSEIVYRRTDGTYQKVTVVDGYNVSSGADLSILYFDAAITGISPYKVMPVGWHDTYTPSTRLNPNHQGIIPTLRKAMHSSLDDVWGSYILINRIISVSSTGVTTDGKSLINTNNSTAYTGEVSKDWGDGIGIGGDSGGPSFLLINDEPILISSQYQDTSAVNLAEFKAELETAMDTLASAAAGTYTFTHPDLSGFTTY